MPNISNQDLVKLLNIQHDETSKRLEAIEEQVKYTNGQVRVLNTFKAVIEDRDKRVLEARSSSNPNDSTILGLDIKSFLAVLAVVVAAAVSAAIQAGK